MGFIGGEETNWRETVAGEIGGEDNNWRETVAGNGGVRNRRETVAGEIGGSSVGGKNRRELSWRDKNGRRKMAKY